MQTAMNTSDRCAGSIHDLCIASSSNSAMRENDKLISTCLQVQLIATSVSVASLSACPRFLITQAHYNTQPAPQRQGFIRYLPKFAFSEAGVLCMLQATALVLLLACATVCCLKKKKKSFSQSLAVAGTL
jgi:hypothetical protein